MQYIVGLFSLGILGIVCVLIMHYKLDLFNKGTYKLNKEDFAIRMSVIFYITFFGILVLFLLFK